MVSKLMPRFDFGIGVGMGSLVIGTVMKCHGERPLWLRID